MREFLLFVFIAKATADRLGYDYQTIGQAATFGSESGTAAIGGAGHAQSYTNSQTIGIADAFSSGFGGLDSSNNNRDNNNSNNIVNNNQFSNIGTASYNGNSVNIAHGHNFHSAATQPIEHDTKFYKEFFSYKAPPEDDNLNDDDANGLNPTSLIRKTLRVIFIRAPENQALTNAALQLAKQATEDRTAIYVLTKQTDAAELAKRLQAIKTNQQQEQANKPEVHFVKYRTPEDAVRAQLAIKAQYDALDGPTLSSNEGVAPVLNFANIVAAGGVGHVGGVGRGSDSFSNGLGHGSANGYLPPAQLRL